MNASSSRLGVRGTLASGSDVDWYEVALTTSELTTFALDTVQAGNVTMTLHDAGGTQLAAATAADNAAQLILEYDPPSDTSYFVRISGDALTYSLAAVTATSFNVEANDTADDAQSLNDTLQVVGHVGSGNGISTVSDLSVNASSDSTATFTETASGIRIPNVWLEGAAAVTESNGTVEIQWSEARDPRDLMGSLELTENFLSVGTDVEGDIPRAAVFTADGSKFLVAHRLSDNIVIYNSATRAIEANIATAGSPLSLAITPDGKYAVSANSSGDTVTVIDLATLTKAAEIPLSKAWPYRIHVTEDSKQAVVATADDYFVVVSMETFSEVRTIASPFLGSRGGGFNTGRANRVFLNYTDFVISPDSQTLVAPGSDGASGGMIRIYDLATGEERAALATPSLARGAAITADNSKAYVSTHFSSDTIVEVDLNNGTILRTLNTEDLPGSKLLLSPDENFAITGGLNKLLFIDLSDGSTSASVGNGSPGDFALSFDGKYVLSRDIINVQTQSVDLALPTFGFLAYVAVSPADYRGFQGTITGGEYFRVVDIDGVNGGVEADLIAGATPEGDTPLNVAFSPDNVTAVTVNHESGNITVVDLVNRSVLAYVDVGVDPEDVEITPDGNYAVVSNVIDNSVTVVDLTSNTAVKTLTGLTENPHDVLISHDGNTAFINTTGHEDGDDRLYFIDLDGASSTLDSSSLLIGDIARTGVAYSRMSLSPDGSLLVVPASRDDQLVFIDTASRTEVARLIAGQFPDETIFSPDGNTLYSLNTNSDTITVINVDGGEFKRRSSDHGLRGPWQLRAG